MQELRAQCGINVGDGVVLLTLPHEILSSISNIEGPDWPNFRAEIWVLNSD